MRRSVLLPITLPAYPDELLGSWLSRLAQCNSDGGWHAFLNQFGFSKRTRLPIDLIRGEDKYQKFFDSLGMTLKQVKLSLTTYPFYASLDSKYITSDDSRARANTIDKLSTETKDDLIPRKLPGFFIFMNISETDTRGLLKLCPCCIKEDSIEFGEPYWHRSHQLPTVFFCGKHHCRLHSSCSRCARVFFNSRMGSLPGTAYRDCPCGFDLSELAVGPPMSDLFGRLNSVSLSALHNIEVKWSRNDIYNFLSDELAKSKTTSTIQSHYEKLFENSDIEIIPTNRNSFSLVSDSTKRHYFNVSSRWDLDDAITIAFVIASLDFSFDELYERLSSIEPKAACLSNLTGDDKIEHELRQWKLSNPNTPINSHPLYWNLRINHAQILEKSFPKRKASPIPSIDFDRKKLVDFFNQQKFADRLKNGRPRLFSLTSRSRMLVRDREWYEEYLKAHQKTGLHIREKHSKSNIMSNILSGLNSLVGNGGKPIKPTFKNIAKFSAVTPSTITKVFNEDAEIKNVISEAREKYPHRAITWAAQDLHIESYQIGIYHLIRHAGLSPNKENVKISKNVLGI